MIDFTKWHNWVGLAAAALLIGVLLHQIGKRVGAVGNVVAAAYGS